ncbi:MAG: hypothetical protein J6A77_04735 [Lachnospiraceae bacterium]|nr:hypothetical protein [Lachnospiraceae bacterium]
MNEIRRYYIVIFCYGVTYLFGGWRLGSYAWLMLFPLTWTYVGSIRILLGLLRKNQVFVPKTGSKTLKMKQEALGTILALGLVLLHLYFGVLCVRTWIPGAYAFSYEAEGADAYVTDWDLLYYTVLHFTEIGCGDIIPQHVVSRGMAVVIALTSVFCLIVFMSSFMEEEEEIKESE